MPISHSLPPWPIFEQQEFDGCRIRWQRCERLHFFDYRFLMTSMRHTHLLNKSTIFILHGIPVSSLLSSTTFQDQRQQQTKQTIVPFILPFTSRGKSNVLSPKNWPAARQPPMGLFKKARQRVLDLPKYVFLDGSPPVVKSARRAIAHFVMGTRTQPSIENSSCEF